jgi:hypothetical protein
MTGKPSNRHTAPNALISCAETWPGKTVHGSVAVSHQTAGKASDASKQP